LLNISKKLHGKVAELERSLSALQLSKLILGVDRNKYRRELVSENLWDFLKNMATT
jgi:hypothetical protein